jgi:ATP-binding protein involved in chromosome partitioning
VQLSLIQKSRPAGAVVVSTPQDLSLIDARRAIDLFGKTSVPVLGLIENMAGYQCPHCGETSDPFGSGGAEAAAAELGVPFLGRLPLSASLRAESDAGRPPAGGDGPAAAAFRTLAEAVLAQLDARRLPPSSRARAGSARRCRGEARGRRRARASRTSA